MNIVDWRTLSSDRMAVLFAEEARRWSNDLEWDTAIRWQAIERERRLGIASGLVVLDETGTAVLGWSHHQVRHRALEIYTLSASSDAVAQALLDRMLSATAPAGIERVSLFVFSDAANLAQTVKARGLAVDRYWYLGRDLQRVAPASLPDMRGWRVEDLTTTAALLSRAYEAGADARPFAPGGTPDDWMNYLNDVSRGTRYGTFQQDASFCITAGPSRLVAVALVTGISDSTAHLAQLAVDPQMRRRRVGPQLMEIACAAAARAGYRRITVQVGGSNRNARSLFEGSRFTTLGTFVAGGALQPRRSTSVAPGGAVMTRR